MIYTVLPQLDCFLFKLMRVSTNFLSQDFKDKKMHFCPGFPLKNSSPDRVQFDKFGVYLVGPKYLNDHYYKYFLSLVLSYIGTITFMITIFTYVKFIFLTPRMFTVNLKVLRHTMRYRTCSSFI